jgi:uncharacterized cupredoxin-like copper-binding protein
MMILTQRRAVITAAVLVGSLAATGSASAETVVKVSLWDKGPSAMAMVETHAPMGMAMDSHDPAMATMGITLDVATVPAGEVTFKAVNDSLEFYHEMLISPISDPASPLPYNAEEHRVDEAALGVSFDLGELKSHASGKLTVTMTPGTYILYCNIAGHYAMGMWTLLTVTE